MPDQPSPIRAEALAARHELHARFDQAQPFRHVVIDDFLRPEVCREMVQQFPPFATRNAVDENGKVGGKSVYETVSGLGPVYAGLDRYIQGEEFLRFIGDVSGIEDLLYDPLYYGGGTHENRHGQELDPHVDFNYHAKYGWHRRLNLIVYLNERWEEEWGGALELHSDPWAPPEQDEVKTVVPRFNRCVLFETTESSWHGFRAIHLPPGEAALSRRSFAIYLYTTDRPAELTAPGHDTVYVERPLPGHIVPGHVLSPADHAELQRLISRRDGHLRRLYGRELRFAKTIANLREQLEAKSAARRTIRIVTQSLRPFLYRLRRRLSRNG